QGVDVVRGPWCVETENAPRTTQYAPRNTHHAPRSTSLWIEDKYDGIRCQLHKVGERVSLYSRDLKEITRTFPDVADGARQLSADVILDGEIMAMRGDIVLPFAELQKRLGRRE